MAVDTLVQAAGLSEREVCERRARHQGNTAPPPSGRTYAQILRENLFTSINGVFFGLGAALTLVGRPLDALVWLAISLANVVVSITQEVRAKRALDRIAVLTRPRTIVIRDGREQTVAPDDLVIGDLVRVGPGDQIVLDGQVVAGRMGVDESQLSGESDLIPKRVGDTVYSGSFCVNGAADYTVTAVAADSLAQQMTSGARAFRRVLTPLQRQVMLVVSIMLACVTYLEILLVVGAVRRGALLADTIGEATMIASLVPNGLFVAIALTYALGIVRLLRFGALVQQSNAVESLSHVSVLCLDKTGTLTANRLRVTELVPLGVPLPEVERWLAALVASSSGRNATAEAIGAAYPSPPWRTVAEVPFASARKWSAVALADGDLRGIVALGAPAMLQPYLGAAAQPGTTDWETLAAQVHARTERGLRVLLMARGLGRTDLRDDGDASRLPDDLMPIGLVCLSDELRPEARETLAAFARMGVTLKIISGDTPETVATLARQVGLDPGRDLVSGRELEAMDEAGVAAAARRATIFGLITPRQKERLVTALRRDGHYVAVIGDGVNDVLALKRADLGIALQGGSQATRAVADMVLTTDSFAALVPTVAEGRRIRNGMHANLMLFLTRVTSMALVIIGSLVIGVFPLALRQVALVTLLTVGIPSLLLAVWARPERQVSGDLRRGLLQLVLPAALVTGTLGLAVFHGTDLLLRAVTPSLVPVAEVLATAQTALVATLVMCGLLLVIVIEPPTPWWASVEPLSGDWRPTLLAIGLMLVFGMILTLEPLRDFFSLAPLPWPTLLLVGAGTSVWLLVLRRIWRSALGASLDGLASPAPAAPEAGPAGLQR